jgi:hypothetical protein
MADERQRRIADDPPPALAPGEVPTKRELARIARKLLRERAEEDLELALKMRERGIDLGGPKRR